LVDREDVVKAVRANPALAEHQPRIVNQNIDVVEPAKAVGEGTNPRQGGDLKPRRGRALQARGARGTHRADLAERRRAAARVAHDEDDVRDQLRQRLGGCLADALARPGHHIPCRS